MHELTLWKLSHWITDHIVFDLLLAVLLMAKAKKMKLLILQVSK